MSADELKEINREADTYNREAEQSARKTIEDKWWLGERRNGERMPLTKIPRIDRYLTLLPGSLRKSHNTYKIRGRSTRAKPASWVSQSTRASGPNTTWYTINM